MLFLNQSLLILLQSLEFHLFFSNQLDGKLTSLIYNGKICLFLSFACCWSLHNTIQHYGACIDVIYLKQLLAYGDLASKNWVDIQSQKLSDYQLHLSSNQSFLDHGISGNVEMRFIQILSCSPQYILILLFIVFIVQCFFQCLFLLCESIQLLGRDHRINMGNITQWGCHEGGQHLWISQNVLIEGNWVIGITQLGLTVGKDASNSD